MKIDIEKKTNINATIVDIIFNAITYPLFFTVKSF